MKTDTIPTGLTREQRHAALRAQRERKQLDEYPILQRKLKRAQQKLKAAEDALKALTEVGEEFVPSLGNMIAYLTSDANVN